MKKISLIVILSFLIFNISAQDNVNRSAESVLATLTKDEMDELIREDIVFRLAKERPGLHYLPDVPLAARINNRFDEIEPDVTVEAFFKVPYPQDMPEGTDRDLILYNIVREVSGISGVQYWSRTKDRFRVLFDDVYVIDENRNPVEDSFVDRIPPYDSFGIHMDEANLGRDYYLAEYNYDGTDMSFSLTNTSNISFLLRVVGKGDMQIDLLLMPLDNEIIIYGYCGVKLANPGFVNRLMDPYSSFFRRLYAMNIWFYNSLHGTDILPDKTILSRKRTY